MKVFITHRSINPLQNHIRIKTAVSQLLLNTYVGASEFSYENVNNKV